MAVSTNQDIFDSVNDVTNKITKLGLMLHEELEGTKALQSISTEMMSGDDDKAIYEKLLYTAMEIMHADYASIQMLVTREDGEVELSLLANFGFNEEAANFWNVVTFSSYTTCGEAMRSGQRIIVVDMKNSDYMNGTEDQRVYLQAGIHSCQTTPLMSRNGMIVGMISTHWREPHEPTEQQLRLLDVLARQAADFIERRKADLALRESEQKARALVLELEESDKNKNRYFSILSHELRNPLASITAGLSLLEISDDKKHVSEAKEIVDRQVTQLSKLVDDLLDLTRINQNKVQLNKESILLNKTILDIVNDVKLCFKGKGIHFWVKIQPRPVFVYADRVRITQCIENLLTNALKFTHKTGSVWLTLEQVKKDVVISVKDNGIGINTEMMGQLFKPFMQVHQSPDRQKNNGLGLGLSIVKSFVDMHDGQVNAYSDGIGRGSLFTISLPIATEPAVL